ncbi:MAG TPA: NAD(P)H-binding protein [Gemmatimonadaceae bacterium]|nr:NAD(P)H-binding protein [Gemmatimonadaceae bacterium]
MTTQTRTTSRSTAPVLVIGATGRIGRAVVGELRRAGVPVRALSRQPATAQSDAGVESAVGDLTVPESLDTALRDVRVVFLVWTAGPGSMPEVVERFARSVERVVFLSSPHRTPHPFFQQPNAMRTFHADIEHALASSGLAPTIVRPGMLSANAVEWWADQIRAGDAIRWPYGAAETAPIDERDIAAVAVRALCDSAHAGQDYVITGPAAISHAGQVQVLGEVLGRRLRFDELTPDEFRRDTASRWPAPVVEMLLSAWGATLGHPAYVTSTVAEVTGAPAHTFADWATANSDRFRSE